MHPELRRAVARKSMGGVVYIPAAQGSIPRHRRSNWSEASISAGRAVGCAGPVGYGFLQRHGHDLEARLWSTLGIGQLQSSGRS